MTYRSNRRAFLRGAGSLAVALPFLESFSSARAQDNRAHPVRFVVFWTANGTHPTNWFPSGPGADFAMSPYLEPLAAQRDKLLILKGIDMPAAVSGAGDDHERGIGACLTGTETIENNGQVIGGGVSLDQLMADRVGDATRFRSLELGVQSRYNGHTIYERISYRDANRPVPPERDPFAAYQRLFADGLPTAEVNPMVAGRRSVLDLVRGDYQRLSARASARDRAKLDAHLTAIREVEGRLANAAEPAQACAPTPLGSPFDFSAPELFPEVGRLQMDMLAMALSCDLTRVGSLMWSYGRSKHVFNWLDPSITEEHHDLSHRTNPDSGSSPDADAVEKIRKINTFYASQLAYFMERLAETPEGDGTLLDNTIILWCNALGEGRAHTHDDIPIIVAGGGGGALRPGRFLSYDGRSTNDLYVSLLQAMNVPVQSFGNPAYNRGALPDLG